jgi:hypothetical protein
VFLYAYVVTGEQLYLKTAEMISFKIMDMISGAAGTGFFSSKEV